MANYGYIYLKTTPAAEDIATLLLRHAMRGWEVERKPWGSGLTWLVFIPGTACHGREAIERSLPSGDPVGFTVEIDAETIAFRHCGNGFERWAQGCMEEALADALGVGVTYDATDTTCPPGTREYRRGATYWEYLSRNFDKPLADDDRAWINRQAYCVPAGFDQGFATPGGAP